MKKTSKFISVLNAILCTLLFFVTQMATTFIASMIISMSLVTDTANKAEVQAKVAEIISSNLFIFSILGNLLFLLIIVIYFKIRRTKVIMRLHLHQVPISEYLLPVLTIFLFSSSWNMALGVFPIPSVLMGNTGMIGQAAQDNILLCILAVLIIGPIIEEIAFRGIIMSQLRSTMSSNTAIVISGLLFGLLHAMTGSIVTVLFACLGGLIFSLAYEKTGSLLVAIATHMVGNLCDFVSRINFPPIVQYILIVVFMVGAINTFILLMRKSSHFNQTS